MIKINVGALIFIVFIILLPNVKGTEDQAYFYISDREIMEKPIVYVGEDLIYFAIVFGQNITEYSFEMDSPLFTHPLIDKMQESFFVGNSFHMSMEINRTAPNGKYPIKFYFNYTNENNTEIKKVFNFTIEYRKSLEIKELKIPKNKEREFLLKIETYEFFSKLIVEFDSDGNIETKKHEIVLENISVGNYTLKTKIYRRESSPENAQELGYWIIGTVNNRTVEFGEKNIPVKINWGLGEGFIPGFETFFLIISISVLICWLKKKKK